MSEAHLVEIGDQPFKGQTWLCGRWDESEMLAEIVGWAVGSQMEIGHAEGVKHLAREGYITTRRHKAPAGEWDAYALTPKGFERLRQIAYGNQYDRAVRLHRFYLKGAGAIGKSPLSVRGTLER